MFGHADIMETVKHDTGSILMFGMFVTKKCKLKHWKSESPPFEMQLWKWMNFVLVQKILAGNRYFTTHGTQF